MRSALILPIVCVLFQTVEPQDYNEKKPCTTVLGKPGTCIYFQQCPSLFTLIQKRPLSNDDQYFIRKSRCDGSTNQDTILIITTVCCPNEISDKLHLLPKPGICGTIQNELSDVFDYKNLIEHPWMVQLTYTNENNEISWRCTGVLITDRYVLSAAHCLDDPNPKNQSLWILSKARFGRWNFKDDNDAHSLTEIEIEEQILHERYDSQTKESDIGLLRLSEKVTYSNSIRPICLPTAIYLQNKNYDDITLEYVGWTKYGTKLRIPSTGLSQKRCCLQTNNSLTLEISQMCAVPQLRFCDLGFNGPLVSITNIRNPYYYCVGIPSFFSKKCDVKVPIVFTKVDSYVSWILNILRV